MHLRRAQISVSDESAIGAHFVNNWSGRVINGDRDLSVGASVGTSGMLQRRQMPPIEQSRVNVFGAPIVRRPSSTARDR